MSPEMSWLLLMGAFAALAFGIDKLVNAKGSLQRAVSDPSRFDVFPDDDVMAVADAVQPTVEERVWPRSDQFQAEARAKAAESEAARELIERWTQ